MPKTKAVTHADLAPSHRRTDLGSKFGVFLIVFTILCGLACFILCLIAEAFRSEVNLVLSPSCVQLDPLFVTKFKKEFLCYPADDMDRHRRQSVGMRVQRERENAAAVRVDRVRGVGLRHYG